MLHGDVITLKQIFLLDENFCKIEDSSKTKIINMSLIILKQMEYLNSFQETLLEYSITELKVKELTHYFITFKLTAGKI